MRTRLLMCPPRHFGIAHAVNPWMAASVGYSAPQAERQWERFVELLRIAADVAIELIDPQPEMPDLVFTANAALISGKLAVAGSARESQRRREHSVYRSWLAANGFATAFVQQTAFAGAGDALFDRRRPLLYAGYGWRSERTAALQLGEILDVPVLPLLLVDERFCRLELALCPLASGHVIAYLDAFSPRAQALLRRTIEPDALIALELDDALAFAACAVELGDTLILHNASRRLREQLRDAGYRVFATDLSAFVGAGGSAKSLTLRLDDGPAASTAAA
jgi:N-dimethylarginine dimethylaminohydrolase